MARTSKTREGVRTLLTETRKFIARNKKRWAKGDLAFDKNGDECSALSPAAKTFCALGFATNRAGELFGYKAFPKYGRLQYVLSPAGAKVMAEAENLLDRAAVELHPEDVGSVISLNDSYATNVSEIIEAFDAALDLLDA